MSAKYERLSTSIEIPTTEIPNTWETLRKQARTLEHHIDSKLIALSHGPSTQLHLDDLEKSLDDLMTTTSQMHPFTTSQSLVHLYSRHLSNLEEYRREFETLKGARRVEKTVYSRNGNGGNGQFQNQYDRMESTNNDIDEILQYLLVNVDVPSNPNPTLNGNNRSFVHSVVV